MTCVNLLYGTAVIYPSYDKSTPSRERARLVSLSPPPFPSLSFSPQYLTPKKPEEAGVWYALVIEKLLKNRQEMPSNERENVFMMLNVLDLLVDEVRVPLWSQTGCSNAWERGYSKACYFLSTTTTIHTSSVRTTFS